MSKKVTKFDLVDGIRQRTGVEKKIVQEVFEASIGEIKAALKDGSTIEFGDRSLSKAGRLLGTSTTNYIMNGTMQRT